MIEFFNAKMQEAKLNTAPGNPVIAAQINLEQNFAFIEVCIIMEKVHDVSTVLQQIANGLPSLLSFLYRLFVFMGNCRRCFSISVGSIQGLEERNFEQLGRFCSLP